MKQPVGFARPTGVASECTYKGKTYAHGATSCQNGGEFRCNNGKWEPLDSECSEAGPPPASAEESSEGLPE